MTKPAKPDKAVAQLEHLPERLRVVYHQRDDASWLLVLWLFGWTWGCVWEGYTAIVEGNLGAWIGSVLMWGAWGLGVCGLVSMLFKCEVLEIDRSGLRFTRTALIPLLHREVPLDEVRRFTRRWYRSLEDDYELSIQVKTVGRSFDFARKILPPEADWLLAELNGQLTQLRVGLPAVWPEMPPTDDDDAAEEDADATCGEVAGGHGEVKDKRLVIVLQPGPAPLPAPSDCRWQRTDDVEGTHFVKPGTWSFAVLGALLLGNVCWNGFLGAALRSLWGSGPGEGKALPVWESWGLSLLLVPFQVIGLVLLLALLRAVCDPWSRTIWTLGPYAIVCRREWFGIGRTWIFPVTSLDRLELRDGNSCPSRKSRLFRFGKPSEKEQDSEDYTLAVVDKSHVDLCTPDRLTEGEARYMGDVILRERPEWFR